MFIFKLIFPGNAGRCRWHVWTEEQREAYRRKRNKKNQKNVSCETFS